MKLKNFVSKLQHCFMVREHSLDNVEFEEGINAAEPEMVPNDVKKGYFAVTAVKDGEKKRFVVELQYLSHPAFVRLLEQASEEFGYRQKGVLLVPCQPAELQSILDKKRVQVMSR